MSTSSTDVTICYPKPDTLAALRHDNHAVIEASAGTGKTFLIEHLVVDLLLNTGVTIDQILVVTFTEKATAELKTRIRAILSRLLVAERGMAPETTPHWRLDADARAKLEQALYAFGAASILTIHGFCHRVLTEHAFQHQRLFTQSRVSPEATFDKAFIDGLRRQWARDPDLEPWLRQWLKRQTTEDLRQLLYRCNAMGVPLRPIYDPAGLWQQVQQLQAYVGQDEGLQVMLAEVESVRMHAQTKKAVVRRIAELVDTIGRCDSEAALPALLDEIDRDGLEFVLDRLDADAFGQDGPIYRFLQQLRSFRPMCLPFTAALAQRFLPLIQDVLRQEKQRQGWFDFDDMLSLVWAGLEGPQGDMLCETLRARYRYALIDEFQDTDAVQWHIFRRLFLTQTTRHFLYVIGDPKQAIYAFRGADVYTYLDARDAIEQVGGTRVVLDTNYRATPAMIDTLNHLFGADEAGRHFFTGRIQYDTPVRCGHPDWTTLGPKGDRCAPLRILQLTPESTPLSAALIRRAFGRHIARTIARLLQPNYELRLRQGDIEQPIRARDIFILTHTANEGGEMGQYLRAEGVPHLFYKQEGLIHTPEALAICDVLAAVVAPHDASLRIRAWATPIFAVPLHQLAVCQSLPGSHPLMQQLLRWKALGEHRDFDALFADILSTSGWLRRGLFFQSGRQELTNVHHLFEMLLEEVRRSGCTLSELVQTLRGWINGTRRPADDAEQMQRLASESDAVQIMTMHKSKGLEAAVVFCYGGFARRPDDA